MMTECKNATYGMMPELNQRIFEAKKNIGIHKTATKKIIEKKILHNARSRENMLERNQTNDQLCKKR